MGYLQRQCLLVQLELDEFSRFPILFQYVKLMLLQDKTGKEQNVRRCGFSFSRGAALATRHFLV